LPDILEIKPLAKSPNCTTAASGPKSVSNHLLILAVLGFKEKLERLQK
jgi:hypothetical protein